MLSADDARSITEPEVASRESICLSFRIVIALKTRITGRTFDEERALYGITDAIVSDCRFSGPADGESALKESSRIDVNGCVFDLRYPLWHVTCGNIASSEFTGNCRAPMWYDKEISLSDCSIDGVKAFRECRGVSLKNVRANSPEFFWKCRDSVIDDLELVSEYPFLECERIHVNDMDMDAKYSFQYCSDIEISDSDFRTKDAFWHCKDVTVRDSVLKGEYLGWYSENLHLVNCRIEGTQPFCYCNNLVLEDCEMIDTDLAFEKSSMRADVRGRIESIRNPYEGVIEADSIGEVIDDSGVCRIIIRGTGS